MCASKMGGANRQGRTRARNKQSSVDLNCRGGFQKTLLLKLAIDSYKNRPHSVIIEYNFS